MIVPGSPKITYEPSQSVYDGALLSLTCTSDTLDVPNTSVLWIRSDEKLYGDTKRGSSSLTNTIIIPASIADSPASYECRVDHPNLPEPLIDYADFTGLFISQPLPLTQCTLNTG